MLHCLHLVNQLLHQFHLFRTTAGNYTRTLSAANGCDSVVNLTLVVNSGSATAVTASICQGRSYAFGSQSLTTAGTYTRTLVAANGCDSVVTLTLAVNSILASAVTASICLGQSYAFGSQMLTTAGSYTQTFVAANGCDSVVTLTLVVNTGSASAVSASICQGRSYSFGVQTLTTAGTYTRTFLAANGCDSVVTLVLSVRPNFLSGSTAIICQGQSYAFGAQMLTTAGTYTRTLEAANGCDSVVTLTLVVNSGSVSALSASICQGQSYAFGTQALTTAGNYTRTLVAVNGCDSVVTLTLTVNSGSVTALSASICQGLSYSFGTQTLTTAGTYTRTLVAANGCDSVLILTLGVTRSDTSNVFQAICQGQSFPFGNQNLSLSGIYFRRLSGQSGCDSIIVLTLQVLAPSGSTLLIPCVRDKPTYSATLPSSILGFIPGFYPPRTVVILQLPSIYFLSPIRLVQ